MMDEWSQVIVGNDLSGSSNRLTERIRVQANVFEESWPLVCGDAAAFGLVQCLAAAWPCPETPAHGQGRVVDLHRLIFVEAKIVYVHHF